MTNIERLYQALTSADGIAVGALCRSRSHSSPTHSIGGPTPRARLQLPSRRCLQAMTK